MDYLEETALIVVRTTPYSRPDAVTRNGIKRRKPEHLIGKARGRGTERMHPAFGICNYKHPELELAESLFEVPRDGIPQIVLDLGLPHRKPFVPEVDFKK